MAVCWQHYIERPGSGPDPLQIVSWWWPSTLSRLKFHNLTGEEPMSHAMIAVKLVVCNPCLVCETTFLRSAVILAFTNQTFPSPVTKLILCFEIFQSYILILLAYLGPSLWRLTSKKSNPIHLTVLWTPGVPCYQFLLWDSVMPLPWNNKCACKMWLLDWRSFAKSSKALKATSQQKECKVRSGLSGCDFVCCSGSAGP